MEIYIVVFAYLGIFSMLEMMRKKIKPQIISRVFYILSFLMLFFIAGFRYGLETDYWTYYREFNGISGRSLEFTFVLLMQAVKMLANNYNVFLIIFSIITLGIKYKSFSKYKFCFSVLFVYYVRFFVQFDLNAIRQGLAIAVIFFALEKLKDGDLKKYIILILVAATIHTSSLILLVLPLFQNLKLTTPRVLITLGIAITFRLICLDKVIVLFSKYLPFVFTSDVSLISNLQYILNNDTSNAFAFLPYIRIVAPTICLFFLTRKTDNELFYKSYLVGAIVNIAFFGLDTIGFRLAAYFLAAEIIIMGNLYNSIFPVRYGKTRTDIKKLSLLFIVLFCDIWTFFALLESSATLVPFRTFLSQ